MHYKLLLSIIAVLANQIALQCEFDKNQILKSQIPKPNHYHFGFYASEINAQFSCQITKCTYYKTLKKGLYLISANDAILLQHCFGGTWSDHELIFKFPTRPYEHSGSKCIFFCLFFSFSLFFHQYVMNRIINIDT